MEQNRRQIVAQLKAQSNAGPNTIVSKHTVPSKLLDMGLRSRLLTYVPLLAYAYAGPGNIMIGPWMPVQMNHSLSFITRMAKAATGDTIFQANGCSLYVQQVIHKQVMAVL